MRKGCFSEEQMVGILREADREPMAQAVKKHGISEQAMCIWRQRFSGTNAEEVRRLRQLEQENARRKKLRADLPIVFGWCISSLDRVQGQRPWGSTSSRSWPARPYTGAGPRAG